MAETVETITVKLKYSKSGAMAQINAAEFDPEKHERVEEGVQAPTPSVTTPPPEPPEDPGPMGSRRPSRG